jgi:hypothetical protein
MADLSYADLSNADLYHTYARDAKNLETTIGSPYYYPNTQLPSTFDPVSKGWILAPYCDFTPDAACDLADINQMFEAGDLVEGVYTRHISVTYEPTKRMDLDDMGWSDEGILNEADITEWLSQAATFNGYNSPYLRGDTDLDHDVDLGDYNALVSNFDPSGFGLSILWQHGNTDGDWDVDLIDYNTLVNNFNPLGYGAAPVPEPSSIVLVIAGLLAATGARCWRH